MKYKGLQEKLLLYYSCKILRTGNYVARLALANLHFYSDFDVPTPVNITISITNTIYRIISILDEGKRESVCRRITGSGSFYFISGLRSCSPFPLRIIYLFFIVNLTLEYNGRRELWILLWIKITCLDVFWYEMRKKKLVINFYTFGENATSGKAKEITLRAVFWQIVS